MKQLVLITVLVISFMAFIPACVVRVKTRLPNFEKIDKYENLLARAKSMDSTLDFYDLRMSYTRTPDYRNLNKKDTTMTKRFNTELNENKNYEAAKIIADSILNETFVNIYVHYGCFDLYTKLGDSTKRKFHEYVTNGLKMSIFKSGDGKSGMTAWLVINSEEEEFIIETLNYTSLYKATVNGWELHADVWRCAKDADEMNFVFDTRLMYGH